jgi:mannan endo-1,4-beta-mannosidase
MTKQTILALVLGLCCAGCGTIKPVTPNASPEAAALLQYLHDLSGRHTLTGQHNYPNTHDASTRQAAAVWGKTPAVFGQDFGFAAPGDKDATTARSDIIAECKRQYAAGAIITLCWHAVRPTEDEPVTFKDSVQGKLTDAEWNELITPGTPLNRRWCDQVDVIAGYLKLLRDARIPVLWRPYHEMNGDWFWWGGRRGKHGTTVLYRQLFDRLANHHHLNNLVWVWNVDRPSTPQRQFADFYPGRDYFDVASLDVYHSDFSPAYYRELLRLAWGKPVALSEVGPPPTLDVLEKQPRWTWWMLWAEMIDTKPAAVETMRTLVNSPRSLSLDDPAYRQGITPVRAASGLAPLAPCP